MRFAHTNIVCHNWQLLVDFYVVVFGCKVIPPVRDQSGDWLDEGTGLKNARLQGAHLLLPGHGPNGPTLEIFQYADIDSQDALPPNARGFGHIAFEVDDVEAVLASVLNNGGQPQGNITTRRVVGVGDLTFVYARDPEGNLLEIQSWE